MNYGSAIDLSPTATKSGYTFVGWNTSSSATTKLSSLNMGAGNVTLYAIYKKTITLTYKDNLVCGNVSTTRSVTVYNNTSSTTFTLISCPWTPTYGGVFAGWCTNYDRDKGTFYKSSEKYTISSNATVWAIWYGKASTANRLRKASGNNAAATQTSYRVIPKTDDPYVLSRGLTGITYNGGGAYYQIHLKSHMLVYSATSGTQTTRTTDSSYGGPRSWFDYYK